MWGAAGLPARAQVCLQLYRLEEQVAARGFVVQSNRQHVCSGCTWMDKGEQKRNEAIFSGRAPKLVEGIDSLCAASRVAQRISLPNKSQHHWFLWLFTTRKVLSEIKE